MRTLIIATVMVASAAVATPASAQRIDYTADLAAAPGVTWQAGQGQAGQGPAVAGAPAQLAQAAQVPPPPPPPPPPVHPTPLPPSGATQHGWTGGPGMQPPPPPPPATGWQGHGLRWGGKVDGHWEGGMHAPGGWKAYRRAERGWNLPGYWVSPGFVIDDFAYLGLAPPPYGYRWSRYYDDAVLIDGDGRVWDSVHGLDWDRAEQFAGQDGYGYNYGYNYGGGYGAGYGGAYPPPPGAPIIERHAGGAGYTQTYVSGGYYAGGYWYPPVTTTTITVEGAPIVTTTTTEYYETRSVAKRRVYHKPKRVVRRCCCCCK